MEFRNVVSQDGDVDGEVEGNEDTSGNSDPPIWSEVKSNLSSLKISPL